MTDDLDKPVHLYEKTHNDTGLKYFGRTVEDPATYRGSGAYWTRHLDEYGDNVTTRVIGTFTNSAELTAAAQQYTSEHEITTNPKYANLLGEDGGTAGEGWTPHTDYADQIAAIDASVRDAILRKIIVPGASYVPAGDRRFG